MMVIYYSLCACKTKACSMRSVSVHFCINISAKGCKVY